jgi:phosphoribosylaminoimidazolecarboxamide formyltransferase/IMP cyclohydrolase
MYALLSVSDKRGVADLARGLLDRGYTLISTGGTRAHLAAEGIACTDAAAVTGFPEMLGGRVKTLHPAIFAGILARESEPDRASLAEQRIQPIDIVVVNLYPFADSVREGSVADFLFDPGTLEQIDIGGPSLLRAAAKNCARVYAVWDPADYDPLLAILQAAGEEASAFRRSLAAKVFRHTAAYDAAIAEWFASGQADAASQAAMPSSIAFGAVFRQELRYGENPHQRAAFYRDPLPSPELGVHDCEQLQGKELSYNNLLDLSAALEILREFAFEKDHFCCILKHNNPCGAALAESQAIACALAWEGDDQAAFGSVIGCTRELDADTARFLAGRFVELILAPSFSAEALSILESKKNLRLMRAPKPFIVPEIPRAFRARRVRGGWLYQQEDIPGTAREQWSVASARAPSETELDSLEFVWKIVKHVRSNAICIGAGLVQGGTVPRAYMDVRSCEGLVQGGTVPRDTLAPTGGKDTGACEATPQVRSAHTVSEGSTKRGQILLGCGAGQMSRVDSVRIAAGKIAARPAARVAEFGSLVLASDAFFPFRDNVDLAAEAGVRAIIQPGGSVRDDEVRAACDEHGIAQVLTRRRHFTH